MCRAVSQFLLKFEIEMNVQKPYSSVPYKLLGSHLLSVTKWAPAIIIPSANLFVPKEREGEERRLT